MAHVFTLTAQTLGGRVVDDSGRPMEFATVSLRTLPDSAIVTGVITGLDGEFSIDHSDGRGDFVQVSTIGYVTCNVPVSAFATPQTISISADNRMLNEVEVRTVRPKTTLRGDAMVTTVAGSVLEHSGNSLDVLAKVPGIISADPADIRTAADGVSKMGAAKLVASYPIGKGRAKIGAEETYVSGEENYFITLDKLPSSEAELTENNISGFAEYAVMLPVGSLTAGIRFEHVRFDYENRTDASKNVSRVRNNWFPTFNFQTKIKDVGLSLAYSTTIKRPRYHEMTTEITYDNRYAYQTGDPTLLNEIQRTLSLNLQWQWLAASASFESVENTIFQRGYPYDDDGVAMIQYSNAVDDARYFNAYLTASPTFGIWNPRYTAGLRMQHFATTVTDPREKAGERELALDDPTAFVYANNAFRLKNKWVVDVDYNFTSRGDVLVSSQTRNKHCLSLAVSKTWLANDALHIRLSWYDVLNKTLSRYSTDYGNCLIEQTNNHYRPTIQLLASFRFNTANSKYKGTGAGQDAKSRM